MAAQTPGSPGRSAKQAGGGRGRGEGQGMGWTGKGEGCL